MAAKFIEESIMDTVKEKYNRNDGINFEKFLYKLHSKGGLLMNSQNVKTKTNKTSKCKNDCAYRDVCSACNRFYGLH